ncbi:hypothetical protein VTL71DRAFT_9573 [Oculimacula yallundae]|uniref:DNL-type domain-containing protein n=1 Tax=Oculimacula yallundae TaxID=86028 RepID=A0ABR4BR66_9HELO
MPALPTPISASRIISRLSSRRACSAIPSRLQNRLLARPQYQRQDHPQIQCRFPIPKFYSTATSPATSRPLTDRPSQTQSHKPHAPEAPNTDRPEYEMTFTCTPCSTRSTHRVSKQGYHKGSVLATCPSCKNRHVISDHLNIFGDAKFTIEDLMRDQGQLVKKGTLSEDGNFEFWADGTTTSRAPSPASPKATDQAALNEGLKAKEDTDGKA